MLGPPAIGAATSGMLAPRPASRPVARSDPSDVCSSGMVALLGLDCPELPGVELPSVVSPCYAQQRVRREPRRTLRRRTGTRYTQARFT
ncbi:hypothetical protein GCM10023081_02650 [Arthrobacter ginkgonis]|uniref:Secreted protein n=1 Tax=Arthrobacter ginkgonis TaxID=1630594 RepID=A0ABP7BTH2_9MICC